MKLKRTPIRECALHGYLYSAEGTGYSVEVIRDEEARWDVYLRRERIQSMTYRKVTGRPLYKIARSSVVHLKDWPTAAKALYLKSPRALNFRQAAALAREIMEVVP